MGGAEQFVAERVHAVRGVPGGRDCHGGQPGEPGGRGGGLPLRPVVTQWQVLRSTGADAIGP